MLSHKHAQPLLSVQELLIRHCEALSGACLGSLPTSLYTLLLGEGCCHLEAANLPQLRRLSALQDLTLKEHMCSGPAGHSMADLSLHLPDSLSSLSLDVQAVGCRPGIAFDTEIANHDNSIWDAV